MCARARLPLPPLYAHNFVRNILSAIVYRSDLRLSNVIYRFRRITSMFRIASIEMQAHTQTTVSPISYSERIVAGVSVWVFVLLLLQFRGVGLYVWNACGKNVRN